MLNPDTLYDLKFAGGFLKGFPPTLDEVKACLHESDKECEVKQYDRTTFEVTKVFQDNTKEYETYITVSYEWNDAIEEWLCEID